MSTKPRGAWVAYYHDRSGATVHGSELEALREAVETSKVVRFVPYGEDIFTWRPPTHPEPGAP